MKKETRKLIKLIIPSEVNQLEIMNQLVFKGAVKISSDFITAKQILDAWHHNKSVICCGEVPESFRSLAIEVRIVTSDSAGLTNVIDINHDIVKQFEYIAEKNNVDIGDHKSNSSGLTGFPSIADCKYCNYMKANFYDDRISNYRITYRSDHFAVMPGLGQFINGYFLVIPFHHIMSTGELTNPNLLLELFEVIDDMKYILNLTYNSSNILVWENGTGNGGYGKAKDSIVHAHVHLAPSSLSARQIQSISGFSFKEIHSKEIFDFGERSYLLIQGTEENQWFINDDPELYIPRQYIRQLIADEYDLGEVWNWRTHEFSDKILQTMADVNHALKNNWTRLPARIRERVSPFVNNV